MESRRPARAADAFARRGLAAILGLYLLLALGYGVVTPLFEAPDEDHHYFNAQRLSETWTLPRLEPETLRAQEAAQPPLYYVFAAAIIAPIATDGADDLVWRNPQTGFAVPEITVNRNAYVHVPAVEGWPWRGHVLAVHLLRALSAGIGAGTLACLYALGALLWPDEREKALVATSLVAFLPQFGFLHGVVSNDPLVIFLCTASLWQLLRLTRYGVDPRRLALLGATLGLSVLTKMSGLLLALYAVGAVAVLAWRDGPRGRIAGDLAWLCLPIALLAGWLLWRNASLYGDVTAANQFVEWAGGDRGHTLIEALGDAVRVRPTFFAVFGWLNLYAPGWVFLGWYAIVAVAGLGAAASAWRHRLRRPRIAPLLLGGWLALLLASWLRFLMRTYGGQGRLMFPALAPMALFVAHGLAAYGRTWVGRMAVLLAFSTSVACVVFVIPNAYALPPAIGEAAIPASATRFHTDMGHDLELVAVELDRRTAGPTDRVWLTSYWRRHTPPIQAPHLHRREASRFAWAPQLVLELHLGERTLSRTGGYHAGGLYPATLWPEGAVVVDRRPVQLRFDRVPGRVRAHFTLALLDGVQRVDVANLDVGADVSESN